MLSNYHPFSGASIFMASKSNIIFFGAAVVLLVGWFVCLGLFLFFFLIKKPLSMYSPIPEIKLQFWMLRSCEPSWMVSGVRTNCPSLQDFQQLPARLQCCTF